MPHLKSAYKNLRKSRRIAEVNRKVKENLKKLLKKPVTTTTLPALYKAIDKAAKRRIFPANKAAHLKSALARKIKKGASSKK
ncbi:MAG: 30S ribosomal protein S20 [Patescibacteria group bacterium]